MLPEFAINSVLVIVAVLFPRLVFRRFFYASKFAKQFTKGEWSERIVISIFWGVIAQLITLLVLSYLPWIDSFLQDKNISEITLKTIFTFLSLNREFIYLFLAYITLSIIISGLIGYLSYQLVRSLGLDIKTSIWKFSNNWHYYFSGELKSKGTKGKLFTWIDLVIKADDNNGKYKMIQGSLFDYTTNATTGDLEHLFLEDARRYDNETKRFKPITKGIFSVPYANVLDMNIRFKSTPQQNSRRIKVYDGLFAILVFSGLVMFFVLPWFFAEKEISFWRIIISYIPASVCYIASVAIFLPKKSRPTIAKEVKSRINLLALAILSFFITKWILGRGFWF